MMAAMNSRTKSAVKVCKLVRTRQQVQMIQGHTFCRHALPTHKHGTPDQPVLQRCTDKLAVATALTVVRGAEVDHPKLAQQHAALQPAGH